MAANRNWPYGVNLGTPADHFHTRMFASCETLAAVTRQPRSYASLVIDKNSADSPKKLPKAFCFSCRSSAT